MKMREIDNSPVCERTSELITVLYGEASDRERRDFELHAKQCSACRAEFSAFGQVRESIRDWRDEALAGFVASPVVAPAPVRKSAVAALRQFFDLSPLWLKGAVGFAAVALCVLAALAVLRLQPSGPTIVSHATAVNPDILYTKEDVNRAVQEAVAKEREQRIAQPESPIVASSPGPKNSNAPNSNVAKTERKSRRPFSRSEREQLAAELRLLGDDELDRYVWAEPNQ